MLNVSKSRNTEQRKKLTEALECTRKPQVKRKTVLSKDK